MADERLIALARLNGIQTTHTGCDGNIHRVPAHTLRRVLAALGVPAATDADVLDAIAAHDQQAWREVLPPVIVLRASQLPTTFDLRLPAAFEKKSLRWRVREEGGVETTRPFAPKSLELVAAQSDGSSYARRLTLPVRPAPGYHRIEILDGNEQLGRSSLIVCPDACYQPDAVTGTGRVWGPATQLYALRSSRNWGIGDFTDLRTLISQWAARGAGTVALNPLHALFPDAPQRASPRHPSSRLFLNFLNIDVDRVEDLRESQEAQALVRSAAFQSRLARLRAADLVDYKGVAEAKLTVLALLYRSFRAHHLSRGTARAGGFRAFQRMKGEALRRHALFEALQERFHREDASVWGWPKWPRRYHDPTSPAIARFAEQHLERVEFFEYLQWLAESQLHAAGWRCEELGLGVGLIGALALSAARGGADTWAAPGLYALGASIGRPPDQRDRVGQDWELAPAIPSQLRAVAYRPFIAALRTNMRHTGALYLQHGSGLSRLYWIPAERGTAEGAWITYPFAELLGIVALESQRSRCLVIAEDLDALPDDQRRAATECGLLSHTVLTAHRDAAGGVAVPVEYPRHCLVAASNPELPTLTGFWEGRDLSLRTELALFVSEDERQNQYVSRSQDRARLLLALERERLLPVGTAVTGLSIARMTDEFARALHVYLARSPAQLMTVQLEDVFGVVDQTYLPHTTDAHPNWCRKLPVSLEQWPDDPRFAALAEALAAARGRAVSPHPRVGTGNGLRAVVPRATYRLQLHREFGFRQAAELVPYLASLGVSHVYCSPYLKARPGSHHGYDIIDHNALNPEIGSREDFEAFVDALKSSGMGQILDVVPNHMGIMGADNAWWQDVLENGPASHYAEFFDIDWEPVSPALKGKVLVPVLGDHYGSLLGRGEIKLTYEPEAGTFSIRYYEHRFPVDPREYPAVLDQVPKALHAEPIPQEMLDELASLITAFRNVPSREELAPERRTERNRDKEVHKRRLARLAAECPPLVQAIETAVHRVNGRVGEPDAFDALHALLETQAYRLAYWRVASDEINYRRFFDVNDLAAVRMENEVVFDATHRLVLELAASGQVDGLRIDHPDGLYDPAAYFRRLQDRFALACGDHLRNTSDRTALPLYVVVEKITAGYERLPEAWHVQGTTGYRFMNVVNGLFVDGSAREKLDRIYHSFTPGVMAFDEIAYQSRRVIMRAALASELTVLANRLAHVAEADRRTRDFTLNTLREALVEVVACFPVYRTYIADKASAVDRRYLDWAVSRARRRSRAADASIFDFLRSAALGEAPSGSRAQAEQALAFARKFQQFTAPVTAKGVEDTAFYRYHRLISLNEVGGDPTCFGFTVSAFHGASQDRAAMWPHTLLATSTHDSKRSEDVRARINVLSEIPAAWRISLRRWSLVNRSRKRIVEGKSAPSRNDEYLLYQTLVGTWPLGPLSDEALASYRQRIQTYMTKAVREAKVESSWINVNRPYEAALSGFIEALLGRVEGNLFLQDFIAFHPRVAWLGMLNSLSQTLLKLTSPGVPDIYQGNELWDLSLVDPDNRRPVDYEQRSLLLAEMAERLASAEVGSVAAGLLENWEDGRAKLYLTWRALELRREHPQLFSAAGYTPLSVSGKHADNVVAFARWRNESGLIVVAGRLFARLVAEAGVLPLGERIWADTMVDAGALPMGAGVQPLEVLTGRSVELHEGHLRMADLFADFPAALLHVERTPQ